MYTCIPCHAYFTQTSTHQLIDSLRLRPPQTRPDQPNPAQTSWAQCILSWLHSSAPRGQAHSRQVKIPQSPSTRAGADFCWLLPRQLRFGPNAATARRINYVQFITVRGEAVQGDDGVCVHSVVAGSVLAGEM